MYIVYFIYTVNTLFWNCLPICHCWIFWRIRWAWSLNHWRPRFLIWSFRIRQVFFLELLFWWSLLLIQIIFRKDFIMRAKWKSIWQTVMKFGWRPAKLVQLAIDNNMYCTCSVYTGKEVLLILTMSLQSDWHSKACCHHQLCERSLLFPCGSTGSWALHACGE